MENRVYFITSEREIKRRRRNRRSRGDIDSGGIDWVGHYIQVPAYKPGTEYFPEDCK